jgi:hypothetical protein
VATSRRDLPLHAATPHTLRSWPRRALPALAALAAALSAGGLLSPREALAVDAEVTATTAAQAYSLRSPYGDPVLFRRRFTQTLGLGLFNVAGDGAPGSAEISVKLRMRFDGDFGVEPSETGFNRNDASSRFVPGLGAAPLDLMYGYVEGRNLFGGWFGFRLGRQYMVDALGWWSFDGALVRVQAPYVRVEGYGGFEQRGGLPLSLGRFERGGVLRGDRGAGSPLEGSSDIYPMFQQAHLAPAWGVALESAGPHWIHARLDYRKVWNTGEIVTSPYADASGSLRTMSEARTSSERVGYAIDGTFGEYGAGKGGVVYDLYNQLFGSYYATLDGFITQRVTVSAEYDYFKPTFDGDSIWNWFSHSPITTATGRVAVNATDSLELAGSGGVRLWQTDDDPAAPTPAPTPALNELTGTDPAAATGTRQTDVLANTYGRYRWETGKASLRGVLQTGDRGRREGVDLAGEQDFRGRKYAALVRGSLFDWRDELRPDRSATSVGYVIGGAWRPAELAEIMLEFEHNMNRLVGQRYRLLAVVNLRVGK